MSAQHAVLELLHILEKYEMKTRVLAMACLCIGAAHIYASEMVPKETAESAAMDYSVIVSGLPWEFNQSSTSMNDRKGQAGRSSRYDFVSKEPLSKTTGGSTSLKVELTVSVYDTPEMAAETYSQIRKKADPDMGLSYARDYLLRQDTAIYHLHTGCVVSEDNFDIMARNLRGVVSREGEDEPQALRCRCGGGCR